jgi:hypothetical protein
VSVHLATYIGLLDTGSDTLARAYRQVADGHAAEADVQRLCLRFAGQCDEHRERLAPVVERYGEHPGGEPERLHAEGLSDTREGGLGLLRDLHDLYLLACYLDMAWTLVGQAAQGARDAALQGLVGDCAGQVELQQAWLTTRLRSAAVQALLVAD